MLIDKKDVRETKGEKNSKEALIWVRSLWKKNNNQKGKTHGGNVAKLFEQQAIWKGSEGQDFFINGIKKNYLGINLTKGS